MQRVQYLRIRAVERHANRKRGAAAFFSSPNLMQHAASHNDRLSAWFHDQKIYQRSAARFSAERLQRERNVFLRASKRKKAEHFIAGRAREKHNAFFQLDEMPAG